MSAEHIASRNPTDSASAVPLFRAGEPRMDADARGCRRERVVSDQSSTLSPYPRPSAFICGSLFRAGEPRMDTDARRCRREREASDRSSTPSPYLRSSAFIRGSFFGQVNHEWTPMHADAGGNGKPATGHQPRLLIRVHPRLSAVPFSGQFNRGWTPMHADAGGNG